MFRSSSSSSYICKVLMTKTKVSFTRRSCFSARSRPRWIEWLKDFPLGIVSWMRIHLWNMKCRISFLSYVGNKKWNLRSKHAQLQRVFSSTRRAVLAEFAPGAPAPLHWEDGVHGPVITSLSIFVRVKRLSDGKFWASCGISGSSQAHSCSLSKRRHCATDWSPTYSCMNVCTRSDDGAFPSSPNFFQMKFVAHHKNLYNSYNVCSYKCIIDYNSTIVSTLEYSTYPI